jgi:DNA primase
MDTSASSTDLVAQVKARLNLAEHVIIPDIGAPQRQGHRLAWRCPFHEDHHPSLFLNPGQQSYRCFGCGARGDALTWLMTRRGWAFREALAYLANLVGVPMTAGAVRPVQARGRLSRPTPLAPPVVPPDVAWQARARLILGRAQEVLWSDAGSVGRVYLQARGLQESTLRAWGLGWCPRDVFEAPEQWGLTGKRIYVPRGVVIPHFVDGEVWALKVRRFVGDAPATANNGGKYGGPRGGQITLYGTEMLQGQRPLFIVEAELDAPLLWQAASDLVDVVALAGAGRTLPAQWLARLLPYTRIFAALDADKAGTLNATRLAALSARVTPVRVPEGNDVTEYDQAGGDVRAWVMAVAGDDGRFPLRVVIPPDEARLPGLAVPAGRWQRQDDGSIVVVYASAEEMAVCREATRVCGGGTR